MCARKRPLIQADLKAKDAEVVFVPTADTLIVLEPKEKEDQIHCWEKHEFRFDYTCDEKCTNETVYK